MLCCLLPLCVLLQVSLRKLCTLKICHALLWLVRNVISNIKDLVIHSFMSFLGWAVWRFPTRGKKTASWELRMLSVGSLEAGKGILSCSLGWGFTANWTDTSNLCYGQAEIAPCESKSPCASRVEILQTVFVVETAGTVAYHCQKPSLLFPHSMVDYAISRLCWQCPGCLSPCCLVLDLQPVSRGCLSLYPIPTFDQSF